MSKVRTDYTPGNDSVPVGAVVWYRPVASPGESRFEIIQHLKLEDHPNPPPFPPSALNDAYPDGVAYMLWRVGAAQKMDNRYGNEYTWVRRVSFRRADEDGGKQ